MKFSRILTLIRWNDFGPEKIPQFLLICFYIGLAKAVYNPEYVIDTIYFTLFAIVSSIYGYLVNDLGDVEIDLKQGKTNAFARVPGSISILIVSGIFLLDSVIALRFFSRPGFLPVWLTWLLLSTFYSIPPFRFKERGLIGIVVPAVAQQTLAVIVIFTVYGYIRYFEMAVLLLFPTVKGLSLIARHQIRDFEKDMTTETGTYAVKTGLNKMLLLYSWFLRIEFITIWLTVLMIYAESRTLPTLFTYWDINLSYILIFVLGLLSLLSRKEYFKRIVNDPYSKGGLLSLIHITVPTLVIPFFLIVVLSLNYLSYMILLLFFIIVSYQYTFKIKDKWLFKLIFGK